MCSFVYSFPIFWCSFYTFQNIQIICFLLKQCPDPVPFKDKHCTNMTSGMVRSITMGSYTGLEVCSKMQWKPFFQPTEPFKGRRINGLVGHWRMDKQSGNEVADDSGSENHGLAIRAVPKLAKFSRGRFFNSTGLIRVANSARLNFGVVSFTVMGWIKVLDVKNPLTTFAAKKGFGCYFGPGRPGGLPGWEIGHGYRVTGLNVFIRDEQHRMVSKVIVFDDGYQPSQLIGQWAHYVAVFS